MRPTRTLSSGFGGPVVVYSQFEKKMVSDERKKYQKTKILPKRLCSFYSARRPQKTAKCLSHLTLFPFLSLSQEEENSAQ